MDLQEAFAKEEFPDFEVEVGHHFEGEGDFRLPQAQVPMFQPLAQGRIPGSPMADRQLFRRLREDLDRFGIQLDPVKRDLLVSLQGSGDPHEVFRADIECRESLAVHEHLEEIGSFAKNHEEILLMFPDRFHESLRPDLSGYFPRKDFFDFGCHMF